MVFPGSLILFCLLHQWRPHISSKGGAFRQCTCAVGSVWVSVPVQCACIHTRIHSGKEKTLHVIWEHNNIKEVVLIWKVERIHHFLSLLVQYSHKYTHAFLGFHCPIPSADSAHSWTSLPTEPSNTFPFLSHWLKVNPHIWCSSRWRKCGCYQLTTADFISQTVKAVPLNFFRILHNVNLNHVRKFLSPKWPWIFFTKNRLDVEKEKITMVTWRLFLLAVSLTFLNVQSVGIPLVFSCHHCCCCCSQGGWYLAKYQNCELCLKYTNLLHEITCSLCNVGVTIASFLYITQL